jgi:hypothetical protein
VREAALKLVDIAENRANIGDEFTDVMVGGPSALAERDLDIGEEGPVEANSTTTTNIVELKPKKKKKPMKDVKKEIAKKTVQ